MKTIFKLAVLGTCFVLMLLIDVPPQAPYPGLQLVPEAHAVLDVRRRTAERTAVVVSSETAAAASAETAQAKQQAAASQQQAAAAQQQAAAAQQHAAAPTAAGGALPLGTVVPALPAGCSQMNSGGVSTTTAAAISTGRYSRVTTWCT